MDVAGGRSAGFGRIGRELRASAYTPLQLPSTAAPAHSLPVVRRTSLRSWTRLGTAVVLVIALAAVTTLALRARFPSGDGPRAAGPAAPVEAQAQVPPAPAGPRPRG
jgi:hypothetical protein